MLVNRVECVEIAQDAGRILVCNAAGMARIIRLDERQCTAEASVGELAAAMTRIALDAVILALSDDPLNVAKLARSAARMALARGDERLAALLLHAARRIEEVAKGGDLSDEERKTLEELRKKRKLDGLSALLESLKTSDKTRL